MAICSTLSAIPSWNALDPYSKWAALHNNGNPFLLTQPIHQQQDFGGSVGGPIIKDKLFYFLTLDGFRRVGRVLYYQTNTVTHDAHRNADLDEHHFADPVPGHYFRGSSAPRVSISCSALAMPRRPAALPG